MNKVWYVYIMTNKIYWVLYVWVTSDLQKRISQHKSLEVDGFTKKYKLIKLVYFEEIWDIETAINREKQLKWLLRSKKIQLIESINPTWDDLSERIF